jgi:hypothetical protein
LGAVSDHIETNSIKPIVAGGNSIPESVSQFTNIDGSEGYSDMPSIKLYKEDVNWKISVHEYAPGPGPGDFDLVCGTEDRAVEEIFHYFFDENEWFEAARAAAEAFLDRLNK